MNTKLLLVFNSAVIFIAVYMGARHGWAGLVAWLRRKEQQYRRVLVYQLLIDIDPRLAVGLAIATVVVCGLMGLLLLHDWIWALAFGAGAYFLPNLVVGHLEQKRRERLETQMVDGITTLASGVRAGLNLVQAMEMLERNSVAPIKQEFGQLLREYQMGLDLNQAMRNAANRIGSPNYRLLFTAIEMHRLRGGDAGESLDRIAESIREIQRLEGKLDALTSQGRTQAWMMAVMPFAFLFLLNVMDPVGVRMLFTEPAGRILLLVAVGLIAGAFFWIRRIMAVDI